MRKRRDGMTNTGKEMWARLFMRDLDRHLRNPDEYTRVEITEHEDTLARAYRFLEKWVKSRP